LLDDKLSLPVLMTEVWIVSRWVSLP
jgi:hypothetical protein